MQQVIDSNVADGIESSELFQFAGSFLTVIWF